MLTADRIKNPESFWNALDSLSIRRSSILQETGLPQTIFQPDARMSTAQLFNLWRGLQVIGGANVGLDLTINTPNTGLSPSFLIAFHARDGQEALQRLARFKALCAPEEFHIVITDGECEITTAWPYVTETEPDALTDATFCFLVNMLRTGTGQDITPKKVELRRDADEVLGAWFNCPISWNRQAARIIFNASDLEIPFQTYNRELLDMLDKALDANLAYDQSRNSLTDQVRWHLRRCLTAGRPELRTIARTMAISERSLQRRLKEEGQSFQTILSDTRHQLACEYLTEPDFDISEIAYLLGYEDQGSFYRAFQKWESQTPAEWRETALAADQ